MSRLRTIDKLVLATLAVAGGSTMLPLPVVGPVGAAPTAASATYTVKNGDFLAGIAGKLKVALPDLLAANNLQVNSLILPGQQLVVPTAGATPAAAAPAAVAAAAGQTYVVKAGDSLMAIAGKLKVKLADLLTANGMKVTSLIVPGQKLAVPAGGALPAAPAAPAAAPTGAYTVVAGDYLFGIAAKLKVKLAALLQENGLVPGSLIVPGQQLKVPAGGTVPPAATVSAGSSAAVPAAAVGTGSKLDTMINFAMAQQGKPYRFFAAGPDAYDCSGLVVAAFRAAGMGIVHQSAAQSQLGAAVDWINDTIKPGDLVFTARSGGDPAVVGHVGIAISATQWVNAPRVGDVVRTGAIPPDSKILAVRRFI